MPERLETRLSAAETAVAVSVAEVRNVAQGVTDIKLWLTNHTAEYRESQEKKDNYHTEIIERLAIIETKQDDFGAYQRACDMDRQKIDHRMRTIEKTQSNQAGKASIISAVVGAVTAGAIAVLAAILGRHP